MPATSLPPTEEMRIQNKWLAAQADTPRVLDFIKRIQAKLRWLRSQEISLRDYVEAKRHAIDQHRLFHQVYGFSLQTTSRKNIQALRNFLGKLSVAEKNIYRELTQSLIGIHFTHYGRAIKMAGRMESIRLLESKTEMIDGQIIRRTSPESPSDNSVHFLAELPNGGAIPGDLHHCSDKVVIQLAALHQDPLVCSRTYVTGHWTSFVMGHLVSTQIAGTTFIVEHVSDPTTPSPQHVKEYTFLYPDGTRYRWRRLFQDEVFAGLEILPGIAYLFLTLLRHLGGEKNLFIKKLYALAQNNTALLKEELRLFFPIIFPVPTYPEIKIFDFLNVRTSYVHITAVDTENRVTPLSRNLLSFVESFIETILLPNGQASDLSMLACFLEDKLLTGAYYRDGLWKNKLLEEKKAWDILKKVLEIILTHNDYAITLEEYQKISEKIFSFLPEYVDKNILTNILSSRFHSTHPDPLIAYRLFPTRSFIKALCAKSHWDVSLLNMLETAGVNFELNGKTSSAREPLLEISTLFKIKNVVIFLVGHDRKNQAYTVLGVPRAYIASDGEDIHRPFFCFPGGSANPDESLVLAAIRELREETGIDISNIPHAVITLIDIFPLDRISETAFFLMDIGLTLSTMRVHPLDDLVKIIKLPLDAITGDTFQYNGKEQMILPSNALLITQYKEKTSSLLSLSETMQSTLNKQLQIENAGLSLLLETLKATTMSHLEKADKIQTLLIRKADFFGTRLKYFSFVEKMLSSDYLHLFAYSKNHLAKEKILSTLPAQCFFNSLSAFSWFLDYRYITLHPEGAFYNWRKIHDFSYTVFPEKHIVEFSNSLISHPKAALKEDNFFYRLLSLIAKKEEPFYVYAFRKILFSIRLDLGAAKLKTLYEIIPAWMKKEILFFNKYVNIHLFLLKKNVLTYTFDDLPALLEDSLTKDSLSQLTAENSIFLSTVPMPLIDFQKKCLMNAFQSTPFSLNDFFDIPFSKLTHLDYWRHIIRETILQEFDLPISEMNNNNLCDWRIFLIDIFKDHLYLQKLTLCQDGTLDQTIQENVLALVKKAPFLRILNCHQLEPNFLEKIFLCLNEIDRKNILLNISGFYNNLFYEFIDNLIKKIGFFNFSVTFQDSPKKFILESKTLLEENKKSFFDANCLSIIFATTHRYLDSTLILPIPKISASFVTELFSLERIFSFSPNTLVIDCCNKNFLFSEYLAFLEKNRSIAFVVLKNIPPLLITSSLRTLIEKIATLRSCQIQYLKIESSFSTIVLNQPLVEFIALFLKNHPIRLITFSAAVTAPHFGEVVPSLFLDFCNALKTCHTLLGIQLGQHFLSSNVNAQKVFNDIVAESNSLVLFDKYSSSFDALQHKITANRERWRKVPATTHKRVGFFPDMTVKRTKSSIAKNIYCDAHDTNSL